MSILKQLVGALLCACACVACVNGTEIAADDAGADARRVDGGSPDAPPGTDAMVPRTGWPVSFGGESPDLTTDLAVDDAGNLYVAGTYSSPATFGDTVLTGGFGEAFVASYTSEGALRWVEAIGTRSSIVGDRVHVAVSGDQVVVAANFNNSLTRDGETLEPVGADILVAAFSAADGSFRWWVQEGGANDQRALDLLADSSGIYVAGEFTEVATIGGTSLSGERFAGVVAAYDSSGAFRWVRAPAEGASGPLTALTRSGDALLAAGEFLGGESTITVGGTPLTGEFGDVYLLALSTDNEVRWAREAAQGGVQVREMVSVGGSTFAVASFRGAAVVGDETFVTSGTFDVLVMAFDATGTPQWGRSYGSDDLAPIDHGTGIATDGTNLFVTGQVAGAIDFGGGELDPTPFMSNYNAFVLEL
ncbi:MAG: hypothetical protein AAGE52_43035, partial [Myxococcota bacterium]